jgi:hypothetical protein
MASLEEMKVAMEALRLEAATAAAAAAAEIAELKKKIPDVAAVLHAPRRFKGVTAALGASDTAQVVASPAKASVNERMQPSLAFFDACSCPLTHSLQSLSAAASLVEWESVAANDLLKEKHA